MNDGWDYERASNFWPEHIFVLVNPEGIEVASGSMQAVAAAERLLRGRRPPNDRHEPCPSTDTGETKTR